MIPMPNLPTDNLYKFFSVAGILVAAISISVLFIAANEYANGNNTDDIAINTMSDELLKLTLEMHDREFQVAGQSEKWNIAEQEAQKKMLAAVRKRIDSVVERIKNREETGAGRRKTRASNLEICMSLSTNGCVVGVLMSLCGFISWWWMVQSHQDSLIRLEVVKLRQEVEPKAPIQTS